MGKKLNTREKKDNINLFDFLDTLTEVIQYENKKLNEDLKNTFSRLYTDSRNDLLQLKESVIDIKKDVEMLKGRDKLYTFWYKNSYKIIIFFLVILFGYLIIAWK